MISDTLMLTILIEWVARVEISLFACIALAWTSYYAASCLRDLASMHRDQRDFDAEYHYLTDPLLTYLEACNRPGATSYSEEGFQKYLRECFGEAGAVQYNAALLAAHDALLRGPGNRDRRERG